LKSSLLAKAFGIRYGCFYSRYKPLPYAKKQKEIWRFSANNHKKIDETKFSLALLAVLSILNAKLII